MKYLLLFLLLISLQGFSQGYDVQIAAYRDSYKNDFLKDGNSPLKKDDLAYLRFYDADSSYRITAKASVLIDADAFIMPVISGGKGAEYVPYALLKFSLQGKALELTVYRNLALSKRPGFADYLFLPFTDETNLRDTYAGGRYLDFREGDFQNGMLVVDFNKAYNPYCAFGGGYACPKPPEENKLGLAIEAGEKNFARKKQH